MKSFIMYSSIIIILSLCGILKKFNLHVIAIKMTMKSFPHNGINISTDQNFVNWNSDFDRKNFFDGKISGSKKNLETLKNNHKENFLKTIHKSDSISDNSFNSTHNYEIKLIDTIILLKTNQTDGQIKERIQFELNPGNFNQIVRKVSLQSSAEKFSNFRLSSYDVKLTKAKIVNNCYESTSIFDHHYICIIASFEDFRVEEKKKKIEIEYEYNSENLLRKRIKPFSGKEEENLIVWIYDNFNMEKAIENVNLQILIEDKIDPEKVSSYPQKNFYSSKNFNNFTLFKWRSYDLRPNTFRNFLLNIPIYNKNSKEMTKFSFDLSSYSIIQLFFWILISSGVVFAMFYGYILKKEKNEKNACENHEAHSDDDIDEKILKDTTIGHNPI